MAEPKWMGFFIDGLRRVINMDKIFAGIDQRIRDSIDQMQKQLVRAIIDALLFVGSLIILIVGLVMLLAKYIALEYLFIIVGFIGLLILLLRHIRIRVR